MNRCLWVAVVGVLLAFVVLLAEPFDIQVNKGVFIFLVAEVLWITEAVHLTATALLVPVLAVLLGVAELFSSSLGAAAAAPCSPEVPA